MKIKIHLLALAGIMAMASCKNNTAETENTGDTTETVTTGSSDNARIVEAPAGVRTAFETKYPQASNIRWQYHRPDIADIDWDWSGWTGLDESDYVVSYNWEGNDYWAWYDQDGNWIGTVNKVTNPATLPSAVSDVVKKDYSGTIVSVDRENDKDRTAYEIELDNGTRLLIDESGTVLKSKVAETDSKTKVNPKDSGM